MRVLIRFRVGREGVPMRLLVAHDGSTSCIEVESVDALGDVSWRPAAHTSGGPRPNESQLVARALTKLADRVQGDRDPDITYSMLGLPTTIIDLGRVTL